MEDQPQEEFAEEESQLEPPVEEEARVEFIEEKTLDEIDDPGEGNPAVVINVGSWGTLVVGLVMLLVGIAAGFAGRSIIASFTQDTAAEPMVSEPSAVVSTEAPRSDVAQIPTVTPQQPSPADQEQLMSYLASQINHFIGDPDAPVTIIEFSDFQWPYCGRFAADAGRQIKETYVDNGQVRFGYWHFAFLGPESTWAAEASECAGDQEAFWEYHDLLFERQSGENQGAFNKDKLKGFAVELDLDTAAFDVCLDSGKYTELVNNQTSTAQQLGVSSTPTFAVNGQAVVGAQPFENFQQLIEDQLNSQ